MAPASTIAVRHNIEVAHRLWQLPGKCERIHGHSMWVTMTLRGEINNMGLLEDRDFAAVKKLLRQHLDERYDHRLLLDAGDPLAGRDLPGAQTCMGQPTTENIAWWIGDWAAQAFRLPGTVLVQDTHVNRASWSWE